MKWRYQPVYQEHEGTRTISLCECYFGDDDRLECWTESHSMYALGETVDELSSDLSFMLAATWKWVPVAFDSLHVGMTFEPTGVDVEDMLAAMERARTLGAKS